MYSDIKKIIFLSFIAFTLPLATSAATLFFDPSVGFLGPGNTFAVDILIDVETCVNAIEADVSFPNDYMQIRDFIIGESVLPIWVERPGKDEFASANRTGILNFVGGMIMFAIGTGMVTV